MEPNATISQVWRFPAKSMLGEPLEATAVTPAGVLGDRGWAVRDEVRGGIRGAKKISKLMGLRAAYLRPPTAHDPNPPISITLPDGTVTDSEAGDVNELVSAALDHQVTLWPLQPATDLDHYRRGAADSDDFLQEMRAIFGREVDEPLPDLTGFPPEIFEYESPLGTYVDAFPLLIMTTTSMRSLQALLPDSQIDVRRFRPNLLVDIDAEQSDDDPWPEMAWIGRQVAVGDAVFEIVMGCPRCVMITLPLEELPSDRAIMRTVVREADQNLGVYATVVEPGTVRVGDRMRLL